MTELKTTISTTIKSTNKSTTIKATTKPTTITTTAATAATTAATTTAAATTATTKSKSKPSSISDFRFLNYLKTRVRDHFGNMNRLSSGAEPAEPRPRLQEKLHRIGGFALDWASL